MCPPCRRGRRAGRRREARPPRATRAELVAVDYEPRDPVTDVAAAVRSQAPQLWPEAPGNIALDWHGFGGPMGDMGAPRSKPVFAGAAHVARVRLVNQRIVMAPMEPRGALARYDARERPLSSCPAPRRAPLCCGRTWRSAWGCRRSASASSAAMSAAPSACARPAIRNIRRCSSRRSGPAVRCAGWRAAPRGF